MGYTFDYFVGPLKCDKCGVVSAANTSTNIQAKIGIHPALAAYGVGDYIELDVHNIVESGYLCIRTPTDATTFALIDEWECPNCDAPFNWVLIGIENGIVRSLKNVKLEQDLATRANYINDDCTYFGWNVVAGVLTRIEE
jgi:hypothetical protein